MHEVLHRIDLFIYLNSSNSLMPPKVEPLALLFINLINLKPFRGKVGIIFKSKFSCH